MDTVCIVDSDLKPQYPHKSRGEERKGKAPSIDAKARGYCSGGENVTELWVDVQVERLIKGRWTDTGSSVKTPEPCRGDEITQGCMRMAFVPWCEDGTYRTKARLRITLVSGRNASGDWKYAPATGGYDITC